MTPNSQNTKTVIIVDDEERLRRGLARSLGGKDCEAWSVASGKEALSLMKERKADLLITDLFMPDMDGLTLIRRVLEMKPEMKVIIITAYGSAEIMREANKLGVTDFLAKPFELSVLKSKVHNLLFGERSDCCEPGCEGKHQALCFTCFIVGKTAKIATHATRKVNNYMKPMNIIRSFGKASKALVELASMHKKERGKK